jgi:vacuolar-type H+-ATPase subunit H
MCNDKCIKQLEDTIVKLLEESGSQTHKILEKITDKIDLIEEKRVDGQERTELILQASKASLEAHKDKGANGSVTKALEDINKYLTKKAAC